MVLDRATTAGATASRLATTSTPTPSTAISLDRHYGDGHSTQVGGKGPPDRLTQGNAQRDADDDSHQGDRGRLPAHGGANLALDEPERLQEPDLVPASSHADH